MDGLIGHTRPDFMFSLLLIMSCGAQSGRPSTLIKANNITPFLTHSEPRMSFFSHTTGTSPAHAAAVKLSTDQMTFLTDIACMTACDHCCV